MARPDDARTVPILVGLNAVVVAVTDDEPRILTVRRPLEISGALGEASLAHPTQDHAPDSPSWSRSMGEGIPFGPLDPASDRTLELGLRRWVSEQTGLELGYLEQLYTFGDRYRGVASGERVLSVAYLALARQRAVHGTGAPRWSHLYEYFPWEDWRAGRPGLLDGRIIPGLTAWINSAPNAALDRRRERAEICFGLGGAPWDRNRVLDRYELLYEARLIPEAERDDAASVAAGEVGEKTAMADLGRPMALDHRRIAATALERLRGKISYRPVAFELLPEAFTLLQLQRVVEALAGEPLHKQNFRRLVEQSRLVERTGGIETRTGGRPAELFCFRREVLRERPAPGVGLPRRRLATDGKSH